MSYTVVINNDIQVACDTADQVVDLLLCMEARRNAPLGPAEPEGAPDEGQTAVLPTDLTTRWYRCPRCPWYGHVTATARSHAKVKVCPQPGCGGECERLPADPSRAPVG